MAAAIFGDDICTSKEPSQGDIGCAEWFPYLVLGKSKGHDSILRLKLATSVLSFGRLSGHVVRSGICLLV